MRRKLFEEDLTDLSNAEEIAKRALDSVDDQIDGQLIIFEKHSNEAAKGDAEVVLEMLKNRSLAGFLFEQEPGMPTTPEEPTEDLFSTSDEPKAEDPKGSESPKAAAKPMAPKKPALDVDVFAKNVARLCFNSENLLIIRPVIINRAVRFLKENYGEEYSESLIDTLDNQFDLRIQDDPDAYDVPLAPGAAKSGA